MPFNINKYDFRPTTLCFVLLMFRLDCFGINGRKWPLHKGRDFTKRVECQ